MNNKRKIINTLRRANKASVEKLMAEEAKKNEIFAKAQRRANIEQTEYADSVSGVEKYERKINMTRIASIAAIIAVFLGSLGGGAYLMKNNRDRNKLPEPVLNQATTQTDTTNTVTTAKAASTTAAKTTTTEEVSAISSALTTVTTASSKSDDAVVSGSQQNNSDEQNNTSIEDKVLSYIGEYSQIGETEKKIYKEYARIIDDCSTMIKNKDASGLKYENELARELLYASDEIVANIGYAFYDVNEDGIMELLLGVNYDYGTDSGDFDSVIYNIFSVNADNEVYNCASGGLRSRYYICSNPTADRAQDSMVHSGFISNEGSGGAAHTSKSYYRLGYNGLNFVESVNIDGLDENNEPIIYYNNSDQSGRDTLISQDEANRITDGYSHVFIQFNSFE